MPSQPSSKLVNAKLASSAKALMPARALELLGGVVVAEGELPVGDVVGEVVLCGPLSATSTTGKRLRSALRTLICKSKELVIALAGWYNHIRN
jgi:hypothetical protein